MAEPMRALSIQQPWASAIAYGPKRIENRSWYPPVLPGTVLAIHASKGPDWDAPDKAWTAAGLTPYRDDAPRSAWTASLALGAVVAVAVLDDWHDGAKEPVPCSPWAARWQYHWLLIGVQALPEPVPCRGMLGLWRLPDEVEKLVREQLEASNG